MSSYENCFQGVGKTKNFKLKISTDKKVTPVCQPVRRIPYHLREEVSVNLPELEHLDLIEKVTDPIIWVSPVFVVPKADNDIYLCVDVRQANKAVLRERQPIPMIEKVLQDITQSQVFNKLNIKWAYHQIKLEPQSREITLLRPMKVFTVTRD